MRRASTASVPGCLLAFVDHVVTQLLPLSGGGSLGLAIMESNQKELTWNQVPQIDGTKQ